MAIINEELETFNYLATIENILQKETRQVSGNKSYVDKIVPEHLLGIFSHKLPKAEAFSDNLNKTFYESAVIALISIFERIVFSKYRTSYGKIRTVVKENSDKPWIFINPEKDL